MYGVPPPQGSGLAIGSVSQAPVLRTYQAWKGSNKFLLGGRFIFGPDLRSLPLTISLIVAPVVLFCVFVARKLVDNYAGNWGISIMVAAVVFTLYVLVLLFMTSGRDPGIIPRNAHPPEHEGFDRTPEIGQTPQLRLPRVKEVDVNGVVVKIKYCDTCMLYRPPRCSHCSICNNCVERFDHHCPWVGQCIGVRNYRFFFMFVSSTTLLCIYVFAFCWIYIRSIMEAEKNSIWKAMLKTPVSIVLIAYTFITVWFVGGLTAFHLYLIATNQTTYENFRYRYDQRANPYNKGPVWNFGEIFCSRIPSSKNDFRAEVPRESGLPASTSGGYVSSGKGGDEIEMGRKAVWADMGANNGEGPPLFDDDGPNAKDGIVGALSPEFGVDLSGQPAVHPRRSSWGRSGSWDLPREAKHTVT